jgi:NADPH:quinone reductase
MRAAWYVRQGPARNVLVIGEMPDPEPGPGEVRIRVVASGVNPGDIKKRQNVFGYGMPYPRVIPHSDGAGVIDRVGAGVPASRLRERVWCYGAQSYRPYGTAAQYVVVPSDQAVPLPEGVSFEQGACLGIPGITAHRCVHVAGPVADRVVLVQGGAGAVGICAVQLARRAGARVIATVRAAEDEMVASRAGAHEVVCTTCSRTRQSSGLGAKLSRSLATSATDLEPLSEVIRRVRTIAPQGVSHIVEVAFDANIALDTALLSVGGSLATFATGEPAPTIPFWELLFKNITVYFLGSDDFPAEAKSAAARDLNAALESGWPGFETIRTFALSAIADAHESIERESGRGRVVVTP